ncbi:MAG: 2-C-methyl-D-erythritol 4-phosphate cytidylyltransferase [Paraglaciecola sp.]|jgi:2-C-methyl-D-erythritol 4-phosphate cytidylyltransferase
MSHTSNYTVVVPAAGVGKRMLADRPKQYLHIAGKTLLEHTLENLYRHPKINRVVVVLNPQDPYFAQLPIANAEWLDIVDGGEQRCDSVLAGLNSVSSSQSWVLVHDAARPCFEHGDLDKLLHLADSGEVGGILASPVRDTMKRSDKLGVVLHTEPRTNLWHALTPQFFPLLQLRNALEQALQDQLEITDEASAIEYCGGQVILIEGSSNNIKVTRPEDLQLAEFYLREKR